MHAASKNVISHGHAWRPVLTHITAATLATVFFAFNHIAFGRDRIPLRSLSLVLFAVMLSVMPTLLDGIQTKCSKEGSHFSPFQSAGIWDGMVI